MKRKDVYLAIDSERDYQDKKYGNTASGGILGKGERSVDEFCLYILGLSNELAQMSAHKANAFQKTEIIRKIAALAVNCMEQHGVRKRKE